jgi:hypothetical protein
LRKPGFDLIFLSPNIVRDVGEIEVRRNQP